MTFSFLDEELSQFLQELGIETTYRSADSMEKKEASFNEFLYQMDSLPSSISNEKHDMNVSNSGEGKEQFSFWKRNRKILWLLQALCFTLFGFCICYFTQIQYKTHDLIQQNAISMLEKKLDALTKRIDQNLILLPISLNPESLNPPFPKEEIIEFLDPQPFERFALCDECSSCS